MGKAIGETVFRISAKDQNNLTVEETKFILEQAEKALKELSDAAKDLASRTIAVIGVTSGALVGIVAYAFTKWHANKVFDEAICTSGVVVIYLTILVFRLITNYKGQDYLPIGTEPTKLLSEKIMAAPNTEIRKLWFYIAEIGRYQVKIEYNRTKNNRRWKEFNHILVWLALTPVISGIILAIFIWTRH